MTNTKNAKWALLFKLAIMMTVRQTMQCTHAVRKRERA